MTSDQAIAERFLAENPDVEVIEALLVDINGVHRGKWIPRHRLTDVFAGEFRLPLTSVTPDIWGRDVPVLCAKTGDGDGICVPTPRTLKRLPWVDRPTAQVYLYLTREGEPWGYDPRVVLANIQARFETLGLTPVMAPELEFMLLSTERDSRGVNRAHSVVVSHPDTPGPVVAGDAPRLCRVFENLLDNAISFSPEGAAIEVEISQRDGRTQIAISDHGPGIPKNAREKIFERFHSLRPASEDFGSHSGLGLAIARTIIEAHDGSLTAQDRADGKPGARLVIDLPVRPARYAA